MSALRKFSAIYEALMLRGKIRNKNQVLSYKKWAIKLMIFYADSLELKISKKVAWEIEKLEVLKGGNWILLEIINLRWIFEQNLQ